MAHELAWKKRVREKRMHMRMTALEFETRKVRSPLPTSELQTSISRLIASHPADPQRKLVAKTIRRIPHVCWASQNTHTVEDGAAIEAISLLLTNELNDTTKRWISLSYLVLAWLRHLDGPPDNHFPVDDLDSLAITTETLFDVIERCNQPITFALILTRIPDPHLKQFVSYFFKRYQDVYDNRTRGILGSLLFVLVQNPRKAEVIAEHIKTTLATTSTWPILCKHIILLLLSQCPRPDVNQLTELDELADFLTQTLSLQFDDLGVQFSWSYYIDFYLSLPDALQHGIRCLEQNKSPFPELAEVWCQVIVCHLIEDDLIFHAWRRIVKMLPLKSTSPDLFRFVLIRLPQSFQQQDVLTTRQQLDLLQDLCLVELEPEYHQNQLDLFRLCFSALSTPESQSQLIGWRWGKAIPLFENAASVQSELIGLFNRMVDEFDEYLLLDLLWVMFVHPKLVISKVVFEIAKQKDAASRLTTTFLQKTPLADLKVDSDRPVLIDEFHSYLMTLDPDSTDFDAICSNLLQAIPILSNFENLGSHQRPLLCPLDFSFFIAEPLLSEYLAVLPLPIHGQDGAHKSLQLLLKIVAVDVAQFSKLLIAMQKPVWFEKSLLRYSAVLSVVMRWDSRLLESHYLCSAPLLASTEDVFSSLRSASNSFRQPNDDPLWQNLSEIFAVAQSGIRDPTQLCWQTWGKIKAISLRGKNEDLLHWLPSNLQKFGNNSSTSSRWNPELVLDIVHCASLGGEYGDWVSAVLKRHLKTTEDERRFRRNLAVASAWLLPRLSPASNECYLTYLCIPLSASDSWRCSWELEAEESVGALPVLRAFTYLVDMLRATWADIGGIGERVLGKTVQAGGVTRHVWEAWSATTVRVLELELARAMRVVSPERDETSAAGVSDGLATPKLPEIGQPQQSEVRALGQNSLLLWISLQISLNFLLALWSPPQLSGVPDAADNTMGDDSAHVVGRRGVTPTAHTELVRDRFVSDSSNSLAWDLFVVQLATRLQELMPEQVRLGVDRLTSLRRVLEACNAAQKVHASATPLGAALVHLLALFERL